MNLFKIYQDKSDVCPKCYKKYDTTVHVNPYEIVVSIERFECICDCEKEIKHVIDIDGYNEWKRCLIVVFPSIIERSNIVGRIQCYIQILDLQLSQHNLPDFLVRKRLG